SSVKLAIAAFTAAVAALDGGTTATVNRDARRNELIVMLRLVALYVEGACKNDMQTFTSSGFVPVFKARTAAQPTSQSAIVSVDQGNSGQLLVTFEPVPKVLFYEFRYAPVPVAGADIVWTTILVTSTRPPAAIENLT